MSEEISKSDLGNPQIPDGELLSKATKPHYSVPQVQAILKNCSKHHDQYFINTLFNQVLEDTLFYSEPELTRILEAFHTVNHPTTEPR